MSKEHNPDEPISPALRVGKVNSRHKWGIDNICEKCGLERRWTRITPKGREGMIFGRPSWEFYVDGKWKLVKIACY